MYYILHNSLVMYMYLLPYLYMEEELDVVEQ